MLLLTKKKHQDLIASGAKTFEIRCGSRYRNVHAGSELSINGRFRVVVESVEVVPREAVCAAVDHQISQEDLDLCYPQSDGPYFVFRFSPPQAGVPRSVAP